MKYIEENKEVLYSNDATSLASKIDVDFLKKKALLNSRKRIRSCFHKDQADSLHEMFIIHDKHTYVRPHKHPGKSESTHIIEGLVDIVLFDDDGKINQVINMGNYESGKTFYFRMTEPVYHTLLIRSEFLIFHEITNGPFDKSATLFAPWAPKEDDINLTADFLANLNEKICSI
jgi:cupin fold WbuC family metalloprotein